MNLFDALSDEITRNEELLILYNEIPQGNFGAIFIKESLYKAKEARSNMDVVEMLKAFEDLKENN